MSTAAETSTRRGRSAIYIIAIVVVIVVAAVGLFTFRSGRQTAQAEDKATQLTASLQASGLPTPTIEQIARVFGTDGGAVCANPNSSLQRAVALDQLTTGTSGTGMRPLIAESQVLTGTVLVMKVYCPKQVPDFQKFVDDLQTNTSRG
jgi:hypothetical protein